MQVVSPSVASGAWSAGMGAAWYRCCERRLRRTLKGAVEGGDDCAERAGCECVLVWLLRTMERG